MLRNKNAVSYEIERVLRDFEQKIVGVKTLKFAYVRLSPTEKTEDIICSLGWALLTHPVYSADLTTAGYHLFRSMHSYLAD